MNSGEEPVDRLSLLRRVKALLENAFGDRLRGVVLYGSEARGEATPDSDIDILVLLIGPVALGRDLRTIIHVLYPLQLEVERPIHAVPVDIAVYEAGEFALYRNAKREGILA
jgi:predicted nucleotidyltransferase